MGGSAEAVKADPLGFTGHPEGAIADQAGTEERRRLQVRVILGQEKAKALVRDQVLGVAAIEVIAGEASVLAEILLTATAEAAAPVRGDEPGGADAPANLESASAGSGP